jgi:hypothetical protein
MHFIFGYCREVPQKMERETPKAVLVGIAILVVLLVVFLSFENIDGETLSSYLSFQTPSWSAQMGVVGKLEIGSGIHSEQSLWRSEFKNSSPPKAGVSQSQ